MWPCGQLGLAALRPCGLVALWPCGLGLVGLQGSLGATPLSMSGITIDLAYKLTEDDDVLEDDLSSTATRKC